VTTSAINIGDRVAYSRNFLRSTGQDSGWAPFSRGTVMSFTAGMALVRWDGIATPTTINIYNLVREEPDPT
jgi:hypothetical protein